MLRNSLKWHFVVDQSSKIKILEIACKTKRDDTKRTFDLQMLIIYIYASFEGISCSLMVKYDSKSTERSGANCIASTHAIGRIGCVTSNNKHCGSSRKFVSSIFQPIFNLFERPKI